MSAPEEEHHETFEAAGAGASKTYPWVLVGFKGQIIQLTTQHSMFVPQEGWTRSYQGTTL